MLTIIIIFVILIIFSLWLQWVRLLRRGSGPILSGCIPVFGHTIKIIGNTKTLWKFVEEISKESVANGGVIRMFLAMQTYYVITDPDDIMTAGNHCVKKHYSFDFAKPLIGDGLITGTPETWRRHRKLLNPAFTIRIIHGFMDIFNEQAREVVVTLSGKVDKGPVDISSCFRDNAMKAIGRTIFDIPGKGDDDKRRKTYMEAAEQVLELMVTRFQNIWMQSDFIYKLMGLQKKQNELIKKLNDISEEVIQIKKAAWNAERLAATKTRVYNKLLLDLMLELSDDTRFTDKEIREEVETFLLAGTDTSSWLVNYVLVALGTYADVEKKVVDELTQVFGGSDRDVDREDLPKLVYTEAVIKETLRLHPVVPLTVRTVETGLQLKTTYLKPGDNVLLSFMGVNRHPAWGPDAEQFKPERWLVGDVPDAFAGFGVGKRNCIGKTYAMVSMKTLLAHLLRRYTFSGDITKLIQKMDFVGKPIHGHNVVIANRSS